METTIQCLRFRLVALLVFVVLVLVFDALTLAYHGIQELIDVPFHCEC